MMDEGREDDDSSVVDAGRGDDDSSVVDAGCGDGVWVGAMRERLYALGCCRVYCGRRAAVGLLV